MWKLTSSLAMNKESQYQKIEKAYRLLIENDNIGFKDIETINDSLKSTEQYKETLQKFEQIVVVGLGGSSLGTKAICDSLYNDQWNSKIYFLDNIDAVTTDQFLSKIKSPEKLGWILCSKSGSTIEVLSLFEYCHAFIKENHNFSIIQQSVVVTETKESPLYNFAMTHNRPFFSVPFKVGGRFSVFTAIGILPLHFLNFDVVKAKKGFEAILKNSEIVCQLSHFLYQSRHASSFYSFQYCNQLSQWSLWLQQLWSESLSKKLKNNGDKASAISTFVPCRGASDQHSVLQQIIEGHESKIVGFHRVKSSEKSRLVIKECLFKDSLMFNKNIGELMQVELQATQQAVQNSGIDTFTLTTEQLNEESMSYLMGLWMLTVGVLGQVMEINAFNQPGVESGKLIALKNLSALD
jgi:glucose-6-phosphate isomerase